MVEYTLVNYILLGATTVVFSVMFVGCIVLVASEKKRWDRKKREKRRQYYHNSRMKQPIRDVEPQAPSTVASPTPSMTVSLRGINEWHLLPPIKDNFRGYTVDSESTGYRSTMA